MAVDLFTADEQPTMANFNERLNQINSLFNDKADVSELSTKTTAEYGSYTGTAHDGSSGHNSLSFSFQPKFVVIGGLIIGSYYGIALFFRPYSKYFIFTAETKSISLSSSAGPAASGSVTWGNKMITISSTSADTELDTRGTTYQYLAIG